MPKHWGLQLGSPLLCTVAPLAEFLNLYSKNDTLHLSFDLYYLDKKKMLAKHEEAKKITFLDI